MNRRFLKGPQMLLPQNSHVQASLATFFSASFSEPMIIESTTASGLVVKRVFEAKEKGHAPRSLFSVVDMVALTGLAK